MEHSEPVEEFEPTGEVVRGDNGPEIIIVRSFPQSAELVWEYLTGRDDFERWYGQWKRINETTYHLETWDGKDSADAVAVEAEKPKYLHLNVKTESGRESELKVFFEPEADGGCDMEFHHQFHNDEEAIAELGPRWEFLLDRLMLVLAGDDVNSVVLDNYLPHQKEHYQL